MLKELAVVGPSVNDWSEAVLQIQGVEGIRVLQGLKALASKHDAVVLNAACETAIVHAALRHSHFIAQEPARACKKYCVSRGSRKWLHQTQIASQPGCLANCFNSSGIVFTVIVTAFYLLVFCFWFNFTLFVVLSVAT